MQKESTGAGVGEPDAPFDWAATWAETGHNRAFIAPILQEQFGIDDRAASAVFEGLARERPPGGVVAVYLDLNHWVALAKADVGRADGAPFARFLEFARDAVLHDQVVFPLSAAIYQEVANITDVRQRADLANVMTRLSQFVTLAARRPRMRCEVAVALNRRTSRPMFPEALRRLGVGVAFAFGVGDGPLGRLRWPDGAMPSDADPAFFAEMAFRLNQTVEYLLLRGPRQEDLDQIPGYDLGAVHKLVEAQRAREQELLVLLRAGEAAKERLGDIVRARCLYWELAPNLPALLAQGGMSITTFFAKDREWVTSFLDDLPGIAVRTQLVMQSDKNASRDWTWNDLYDIEALEAAVPYCDIIITERHASHVMNQSGLARRFGAVVVSDLDAGLDAIMERIPRGTDPSRTT